MAKKVYVIYYEGKPVDCCEVKEFKDVADFLAFKRECDKNRAELIEKAANEKAAIKLAIQHNKDSVEKIMNEIKYIEGYDTANESEDK